MKPSAPDSRRLSIFAVVCVGQVVSQFGSQLTGFALGVWVLQTTGSVTRFSLLSFSTSLPPLLMLLFAGSLADRLDRRWIMILGDLGSGLCTLALVGFFAGGWTEIWYLYPIVAASAACSAFQTPAFGASVVMLVPKEHLTRANAAVGVGVALATTAAPISAGLLLDKIGFAGIVAIDLATFFIAAGSLLFIRIPHPRDTTSEATEKRSLLRDALFGWSYLRARRGLLALLAVSAVANLTLGTVQVGIPPLVLGFGSSADLGLVLSIATAGMVAGGLGVLAWGGPRRRRMRTVFAVLTLQGCILFLGGVRPSVLLVAVAACSYTLCQSVTVSAVQTLWQVKVAAEVQGRVFAVRRLIASSSMPIAYLGFGPLADHLLEPWLAPGGLLAGTVGRVIGVGPGRGLGFLFVILGVSTLLILLVGYSYRPLRELEDELPDAVPS